MIFVNSALLLSCGESAGDGSSSGGSEGGESGSEGGEGGENSSPIIPNEDQIYYGSDSVIMLLPEATGAARDAGESVIDALNENIIKSDGRAFIGNIYMGEENGSEIVVGYVPEREISVAAYELLHGIEKNVDLGGCRYLVYAENGSVCIAYETNPYNDIQPLIYATDKLISEYITDKEYVLFDEGVIFSGTIDIISIQERIDSEELVAALAKLKKQVSGSIYDAITEYCSTLDGDVAALLSELYDSELGGFRINADGKFDPLATYLGLQFAKESGLTDKAGNEILPAIEKYKTVYYLKSIQSTNGYFYAPAYHTDGISVSKRDLDLECCVSVLHLLGESPTYDTVTSEVGDGITAAEYWSALVDLGLVREEDKPIICLPNGEPYAVPKDDTVNCLASHSAFAEYLEALDLTADPLSSVYSLRVMMNGILHHSEILGEYKSKDGTSLGDIPYYEGMTLVEMLIDSLCDAICDDGLLAATGSEYLRISATRYAMEIYNLAMTAYPAAEAAAVSLLEILNSDRETSDIREVTDLWAALAELLENGQKYSDSETGNQVILKIKLAVDSNGAKAILLTCSELMKYKTESGGFLYNTADVDGLDLGAMADVYINMTENIFRVISADKPPIFTEADWLRFVANIE